MKLKQALRRVECTLSSKDAEEMGAMELDGIYVNLSASDLRLENFTREDGSVGIKLAANIIYFEVKQY